jgi:hypothetical protein
MENESMKGKIKQAYEDQIATVPQHKLIFATSARHFVQLDDPDFFYRETDAFLKNNRK